ncbi:MAG: ComF family protein [Candidatus Acidiferrales bacterium]
MVSLRNLLRQTLDALASLVLPAPCRICEETLIEASRIPVCRRCLDAVPRLEGPLCTRCGRFFPSGVPAQVAEPLCHLCRRDMYAFDRARSFAIYEREAVKAITLLKYEAITPLGSWFADRLGEVIARSAEQFAVDVVVPVPLHHQRKRERGFNQAELIARPLARRLGLPLRSYLLVRTRPRPEKLRLSRKERWRIVRGAYSTRESGKVDNLRVLLVDDVFTTGATLDACARTLKRAGAAYVVGITAARVVPDWVVMRAPTAVPELAVQGRSSI